MYNKSRKGYGQYFSSLFSTPPEETVEQPAASAGSATDHDTDGGAEYGTDGFASGDAAGVAENGLSRNSAPVKVYSVRQVNQLVDQTLKANPGLSRISVQGEVSNFKVSSGGHWFFTLKQQAPDGLFKLDCLAFRYQTRALQQPVNGKSYVVFGDINVYVPGGQYRLLVSKLYYSGAGAPAEARERLKRKLQAEGYMDDKAKAAKWHLPLLPERVGIVTSPTSAAVRDIIRISRERLPGVRLLLYPVQVQGDLAPELIARAIEFMNRHRLADVLIVGRGGGSKEDLWAFNEERVARALATSAIPLVTCIGHSIDMTVSDFVALRETATPTDAARVVVPDRQEEARRVRNLWKRMAGVVQNQLDNGSIRYRNCRKAKYLQDPETLLDRPAERLDRACMILQQSLPERVHAYDLRLEKARQTLRHSDIIWQGLEARLAVVLARMPRGESLLDGPARQTGALTDRMARAIAACLTGKTQTLQLQAARLNGVSPLAVLGRGYSLTRNGEGNLVKTAVDVRWGDVLQTEVSDGVIESVVQDIKKTR